MRLAYSYKRIYNECMNNKNNIAYRITELELEANNAVGLAQLSRINIELDNLREQQSENMMMGEYETGCSVDEYQRYTQRW
jgi:S-adenosylhomocysteine hydrolase